MKIQWARLAAPSFTFLIQSGYGKPKKGNVPTHRVILVNDEHGDTWQHRKLFRPHEISKAMEIVGKIRDGAEIDIKHWRKANRKEY